MPKKILTDLDATGRTITATTFSGNAATATSAATWTTARNLAGNSVNGSANVAFANKFIVQGTTDAGLSGAQFLGALGTGIVKNTTSTGVLSIAVAGDFPTLNQNTSGSAGSVANSLVIKADSGTTEGTDLYTFNGSASKTVNFVSGTGVSIAETSGTFTFNSAAATSTVLGGIELFSDTTQTVAANAVTTTASRTYGLQINAAGQGVVNVPWSDTNDNYYPSAVTIGGTAAAPTIGLTMNTGSVTAATIPVANDTTTAGIVSTGTQTFGGSKTFSSRITPNGVRVTDGGVFEYYGYSTQTGTTTFTNTPGTVGSAASSSIYVSVYQPNATTAAGSVGIELRSSTGTASRAYLMTFTGASTIAGSISVASGATSFTTSSDYRLKENLVPILDAAERLALLKPYRFNFIAHPENTVDGFVAHEVQEVVPEAVTGVKDELNEDGSPAYQGIDQSKIIPLLTAALQDAMRRIEVLEGKLNN